MRLKPSDIGTYFHYRAGVLVGVEYTHRPTGVKSGVHPTREQADRLLRQGIEAYEALRASMADSQAVSGADAPDTQSQCTAAVRPTEPS